MAKEIQAFEKYGLHSELVYLPSGPVAVSALLAGDLTMAFAATNAAIASGIFEVTRYLGLWRVDMLLRTVLKICNFGVRVNL